VAYVPASWHDLFVMLGGASAALAGLVFVGLSIHARAVADDPLYRTRARNLTAGILYLTIASAFVLMPGQGVRALGIELMVGGVVIGALFAQTPIRFWSRLSPELRVRMLVATAACLASVYGGASLIAHVGGGLYVVAWAAVVGLAMNVSGAWSVLLGLAREPT
jgi:hypothetical protein